MEELTDVRLFEKLGLISSQNPAQRSVELIHTVLSGEDYLPEVETIDGCTTEPKITIGGELYDNYSVNCYLGLGNDRRLKFAKKKALEEFGVTAGASRLTGGTQKTHTLLEELLVSWLVPDLGYDALVFSAGYLANVGTIPALMSPILYQLAKEFSPTIPTLTKGAIFSDRLNHRCLIDGCYLAKAWGAGNVKLHFYRHMDLDDLEKKLNEETAERKLIVTDGVFSLHGRIAPLREIVSLAERFDALLMVDDAHGTAVFGENGRGSIEHSGIEGRVHIHMGTFSKALAGAGGYIVAPQIMCDYFRYACPTYIFQTAMPPDVAAALIESIEITKSHDGKILRTMLKENYTRVRGHLTALGFDTMGSQCQIVPVLIGDEFISKQFDQDLRSERIFARAYYYNAVPRGEAIIRINLMSTHSEDQLDRLVNTMEKLGKKYGLI